MPTTPHRPLRRRLLIGSTLAFVAAAPASQPTSQQLDALFETALRSPSSTARETSLKELRDLGPAAGALVPRFAAELYPGRDDPEGRRSWATRALGAIATPEAVPALMQLVKVRAESNEVIDALVAAGEAAAEPIAAAAAGEPTIQRWYLVDGLRKLGGPAALAGLERVARESPVKDNAARALMLAKDMRRHSAETLAAGLKGADGPRTREWSESAAAWIRDTGLTGMAAAFALLADPDPAVRPFAVFQTRLALERFGQAGRARHAEPFLAANRGLIERLLMDPDPKFQESSRVIARHAGVDTSAAAEALVLALTDDKLQLEAIGRLIKDRGGAAAPTLERVIANSRDEMYRREVARLLLALPPVDERIDAALRDGDRTLHGMASEARMRQGAEGARKMLALAATLDGARRRRAVPGHPAAYAVALAALDGDDARLFAPAARAVAYLYSPGPTQQPVPSPRAIGRIVALLDEGDADARDAATRALSRMPTLSAEPVSARLRSDDVGTRRAAATMLAGNPNSHSEFVAIPAAALAPLIAAAGDADAIVRDRIAGAIGRFVDTRTSAWAGWTVDVRDAALVQLDAMLNDADRDVRATALLELRRGDGGFERVRAARRHPDASVAYLASWLDEAWAQTNVGGGGSRPAPRPVPELVAVLGDPRQGYWARAWAARDLGRHGGAAAAAVGPLAAELASSPAPLTRSAAAEALGQVGGGSAAAAAALVAAFDDPDLEAALESVRAIGGVGPVAATLALPRLEAFLTAAEGDGYDARDHFRVAAFDALGGLGEAAVPLLAARIEPGDRYAMSASEALRRLGPAAAPAVPAIVGRLGRAVDAPRPPSFGDDVLVETLGKIGPAAARDGAPVLARILRSDALRRLHSKAFAALALMGPAAATPEVIDAMLNVKGEHAAGTQSKRRDANVAFAAMGEAAAAVVPTLVAQVRADLERKRADLARPAAERVGRVSYQLFSESDTAAEAVRALGRIGPKAADALPLLREALPLMPQQADWHPTNVLKQAIARIEGTESPTSADVRGRDDRPRGPREAGWEDDWRPPDFGGPFGPQNR